MRIHTNGDPFADLPRRTLARPVRCIMQSTKSEDLQLSDAIIDRAQGRRTTWTHGDAKQLASRLDECRTPLGAWLSINNARTEQCQT